MHTTSIRRRLRQRIPQGANGDAIDAEIARFAPEVSEDGRAALWLYAWLHAGDSARHDRTARSAELLATGRSS
jgi:hypothetical protein